jgi:hypothetical protein
VGCFRGVAVKARGIASRAIRNRLPRGDGRCPRLWPAARKADKIATTVTPDGIPSHGPGGDDLVRFSVGA